MKFAIPVDDKKGLDSKLSYHYSKCKYFLTVDVDGKKLGSPAAMPNEAPADVKDVRGAIAFVLAGKGIEAVIVDEIAEKDRLSLVGNNIRIFLGAKGTVSDAIKQYLDGKLTESSECKDPKKGGICEC
jgi:predicted Fe-Mo cluster-binding NifX family protein